MRIALWEFFALGVFSLFVTSLLTWPIRLAAIRFGILDYPNMPRKSQSEPIPYLGGVAIAIGISFITLLSVYFGAESFVGENSAQLGDLAFSLILPAGILGAIGLLDDIRSMSPWSRLSTQILVSIFVSVILIRSGTLGTPYNSGGNLDLWINSIVTIVWMVGITNSINFFDNLDGAASGTVAISAIGAFVIAFDRGQELISALSIVTAGAAIGFLIWNKFPAKIYMGDAGALFLGVIISVVTIRLNPGITPIWHSLAIPVMLLAVPLLDMCVAVFSRLARGLSPFTGGKDHLSHRLVRAGLSRRVAAVSLWSASSVCAVLAIGVYQFADSFGSLLISAFAGLWLLALVLFLRTPSQD